MAVNIEYTDEFGQWWSSLTVNEQNDITVAVMLLEEKGINLGVSLFF
jgi:hypothetical protein